MPRQPPCPVQPHRVFVVSVCGDLIFLTNHVWSGLSGLHVQEVSGQVLSEVFTRLQTVLGVPRTLLLGDTHQQQHLLLPPHPKPTSPDCRARSELAGPEHEQIPKVLCRSQLRDQRLSLQLQSLSELFFRLPVTRRLRQPREQPLPSCGSPRIRPGSAGTCSFRQVYPQDMCGCCCWLYAMPDELLGL